MATYDPHLGEMSEERQWPQEDTDADPHPIPPIPQHNHTIGVDIGAATVSTTMWADNTGTLAPGEFNQVTDNVILANPQMYYSYTTPSVDKETIKEALREVLAELAAQDESFTAWLKLKYMTIPVIPEGGNDDQVAKETVDPSAWRFGVTSAE